MKKLWEKIKQLFLLEVEDRWSKCYCLCGHEILQDPLSKIYEAGSSTNIICSKCDLQTNWNLNAPVPILLKTLK